MPPGTALHWFLDALGVPRTGTCRSPSRRRRAAAHAARGQADAAAARQRARRRPGAAAAARQPGCMVAGHKQVAADRAGAWTARAPCRLTCSARRRRPSWSPGGWAPERAAGEPTAVAEIVGALRGAAARAQRDLCPGGGATGRGSPTWPRSSPTRRGRLDALRDRGGGHRPARGVLLVGRQAQRPGRADVPAARRAPRARTSPPPRRPRSPASRWPGRGPRCAELTRASLLTESPRAGSAATTCCAPTPPS